MRASVSCSSTTQGALTGSKVGIFCLSFGKVYCSDAEMPLCASRPRDQTTQGFVVASLVNNVVAGRRVPSIMARSIVMVDEIILNTKRLFSPLT